MAGPFVSAEDLVPALGGATGSIRDSQQGALIRAEGRFDPRRLHKTRRALARVRAATARARFGVIGSSTVAGTGTGTGTDYRTGARAKSFPSVLSARLTAAGLPSRWDNFFGTANYYQETNAIDPRIVLGAGWINGPQALGGPIFLNQSSVNALAFTPVNQFDRLEIVYSLGGANPGSFEVLVDGVVVQTISTVGGTALAKFNHSPTKGNHTVSVRKTVADASTVYIHSMECWDSTSPAVDICNLGWGASDAAAWYVTTPATRPMPALTLQAFDLVLILLGLNAMDTSSLGTLTADVAAWKTAMQGIINTAIAAGSEVLLMVPQWSTADATIQLAFHNAAYELADSNLLNILDLSYRFESYAKQGELGYNISAPSHVGVEAHQDIAGALAAALLTL